MPPPEPPSSGRSTFLTFLLLSLFVAGSFVVCIGLLGPLFFEALAVAAIIGGIGLCHYFLWGRSLSRQADAERGQELPEDEISPEGNDWPTDGPHGPHRF